MAGSQKTVSTQFPKHALRIADGKPVWDISADEVVYRLLIEQGNRDYVVYPRIRQHKDLQERKGFFYDYKSTLQEAVPALRVEGSEIEIPSLEEKPVIRFVDKYFEGFYGTDRDDDVDAHRRFLDARPWLKMRIFDECIQGEAVSDDGFEEEVSLLDIDIFEQGDVSVTLEQVLFDPEEEREHLVKMKHVLRKETEADYRKYTKAVSRKFNSRKRMFITQENYDVLNSLYNDMIIEIDGMVVAGEKCSSENRDKWLDLVPLDHKLLVLSKVFTNVQRKK